MLIFICPQPRGTTEPLKNAKAASKLVSRISRKVTQTPKFGLQREKELSFRNALYINMICFTILSITVLSALAEIPSIEVLTENSKKLLVKYRVREKFGNLHFRA